MFDFTFSYLFRSLHNRLLVAKTNIITDSDLKKSAMVFSPHFDDETLGCGGTIINKVESGADISVVFMADGSQSHSQWMSNEEISALRKSEGVNAVENLGVKRENIIILGFPESKLMDYASKLRKEITNLLLLNKPEQVFLPYVREPLMWSSDHIATSKIVLEAIRDCPWEIILFQYPIWAWFHFPWIRPQRRDLRQVLKNSIQYIFGIRLILEMNYKCDITKVIDHKRSALECHRSQMFELIPDVGWPTLESVANGDFLKLFFRDYEYFQRI